MKNTLNLFLDNLHKFTGFQFFLWNINVYNIKRMYMGVRYASSLREELICLKMYVQKKRERFYSYSIIIVAKRIHADNNIVMPKDNVYYHILPLS